MMDIEYKINQRITVEQFIELYKKTSLGERRPLADKIAVQAMIDNANLTVTAWLGEQLVGIARSLTDFHLCCYLSDLAVDETTQSKGIGKQLIFETKKAVEPNCKLVLISAPKAEGYYPKIGLDPHNSAWTLDDINQLVTD